MNIQEAARMVSQGLLVKRGNWPLNKHLGLDEFGLFIRISGENNILQMHFNISVSDLLADDWEMVGTKRLGKISLRVTTK